MGFGESPGHCPRGWDSGSGGGRRAGVFTVPELAPHSVPGQNARGPQTEHYIYVCICIYMYYTYMYILYIYMLYSSKEEIWGAPQPGALVFLVSGTLILAQ